MGKNEKEIFRDFIRSTGFRETAQRNMILDRFLKTEGHVSVADLHRILNRRGRKVGYATVHRTMKLIAECDLAREVMFDDGVVRFEHVYGHKHHHHLFCTRCKKVIEFSSKTIDEGEKAILKRYGFKMESHRYEIFGLCKNCQKIMER